MAPAVSRKRTLVTHTQERHLTGRVSVGEAEEMDALGDLLKVEANHSK